MIRPAGCPIPSHQRISRRDLLRIGTLAPLTWGATRAADARPTGDAPALPGFGKAERCILLYLWGSPGQQETLDPKPDAPLEVRGEFQSIDSALPGVRVGEILPRIARLLDRVTILRSLTHDQPIHGTAFALSGVPTTDLNLEGNLRDPRHWPFIGSVVEYLADRNDPSPSPVPRNFGLPFPVGSRRRAKPGALGGFLGSAYDTIWSEFAADGTRELLRDAGAPDVLPKLVRDPFAGIRPTDRLESIATDQTFSLDRLAGRSSLLDQLEVASPALARQQARTAFDRYRTLARSMLTNGKLRAALDVQQEPTPVRDRYGMTLFGQSCLAARRLLEAGGKFVTVCWDEYGLVNTGWDTHVHMRSRLKDELGPGFDMAFSSLLTDLSDRGLLDTTAIAVISEHGRTPFVQNVTEGGRDHWARAYSALLAGGPFAQGRVVGRTDPIAGDVVDTPFSPKDVITTLLYALGINPQWEIHDRSGRPYQIGGTGRVRNELFR
ncbi:MAG: DUF1501 domain-containing protein [Planctomycetes bacterium]|nr:DUF1501 domain-containing protein [Planctomycetota bacterium]